MSQQEPQAEVSFCPAPTEADISDMADVLIDCTVGGASVGFMNPLSTDEAQAFWRDQATMLEDGGRMLFVARLGDRIVGTAQVVPANMPNQPHRADISKMLVHRAARRQGLGGKLMTAAEDYARSIDRTVLVLDTASDDAERLYQRHGWTLVGVVPDFALWPDGGLTSTRFYYKRLT